jgi:hypothetical protein
MHRTSRQLWAKRVRQAAEFSCSRLIVKRSAKAARIPVPQLSGPSLRAGLVTAAKTNVRAPCGRTGGGVSVTSTTTTASTKTCSRTQRGWTWLGRSSLREGRHGLGAHDAATLVSTVGPKRARRSGEGDALASARVEYPAAMRGTPPEDEDVDEYEEQLRGKQRAARGTADSSVAALIQTGSGLVGIATTFVTKSSVAGVLAAGVGRLTAEMLKNGVAKYHLGRAFAFFRELQSEVGNSPPSPSAVAESFRHAMAALDEAVFPCLARLVAEYGNRKPDMFFRGTGQALAALDAQSLRGLQSLLTFLEDEVAHERGEREYFVFDVQLSSSGERYLETGWGDPHTAEYHTTSSSLPRDADKWQEIAHGLVAPGLLSDPVGAITYPKYWVRPATLRRLKRIVCEPAPPPAELD